jgi:hypothetical protein
VDPSNQFRPATLRTFLIAGNAALFMRLYAIIALKQHFLIDVRGAIRIVGIGGALRSIATLPCYLYGAERLS